MRLTTGRFEVRPQLLDLGLALLPAGGDRGDRSRHAHLVAHRNQGGLQALRPEEHDPPCHKGCIIPAFPVRRKRMHVVFVEPAFPVQPAQVRARAGRGGRQGDGDRRGAGLGPAFRPQANAARLRAGLLGGRRGGAHRGGATRPAPLLGGPPGGHHRGARDGGRTRARGVRHPRHLGRDHLPLPRQAGDEGVPAPGTASPAPSRPAPPRPRRCASSRPTWASR